MKTSHNTDPRSYEAVVSFNCRVETGEKIRVVLLGVDKNNRHYDFFDATDAVPLDEKQILEIKATQNKRDYYQTLRRRIGL
jgi:hypothetical protein